MIALSTIQNCSNWKRQKIALIPRYNKEDTIRSMEYNNNNNRQNEIFVKKALADIEQIITNDEQQKRLKEVLSISKTKHEDLCEIYNEQFKNFSKLLGYKAPKIIRTSNYIKNNSHVISNKIVKDDNKNKKTADKVNSIIINNKLPYKLIESGKIDTLFSIISKNTFKRFPIKSLDDISFNDFDIIGHHAVHFITLSIISDRTSIVHSSGEQSRYHDLTPLCSEFFNFSKTIYFKYDKNAFFQALSKLNDEILIPEWLRKYFDNNKITVNEFIKGVNQLITFADKRINNKEIKGFSDVINNFCAHKNLTIYNDLLIESKKLKDKAFVLRDKRVELEKNLIIEAFQTWSDLFHIKSLSRLDERGSHLIWLYIISGNEGVNIYLKELRKEVARNAYI